MKEIIDYILLGEENLCYTIENDRFKIYIVTINPHNLPKWHGWRCSTMYIDAALMTKSNQLYIDEVLKPTCNLGKGEIIII